MSSQTTQKTLFFSYIIMKTFPFAILILAALHTAAVAADVDARISERETDVGKPIILQLTVSDAANFAEPDLPTIDGCDVQSVGEPRRMSQVTIVNGRRSESRTVTQQYLVTPRREGTFTIPAIKVNVDNQSIATDPLRFVASKSSSGELMFVEIDGGKKKVFVGQPLDLALNIWIKPFRDPETGQTLSEGEMWNTISPSTSWGAFTDRRTELAKNSQRPGGEDVLRDDGTGQKRSYYLYSIHATIYPKRAGEIDAEDVQIIANYPTALGRSRSPFAGAFGGDFFGGQSPLSRMMNDDLFGSQMGGGGLTITQSRPIVGDVSVDATEVLPIPTAGRPDDYRGAVGQYRIVTQATPTAVAAGDPITLNIGILGTGPMELVQAPPLSTMNELTTDFKVPDDSLAGFVKDDTKLFTTSIRPRRAGIEQIPPIRFSFFNPDTQKFETVMSEPISITVTESETLALDAIVGGSRTASPDQSQTKVDQNLPDFANHSGERVLRRQTPQTGGHRWWLFLIVPPIVWLGVVMTKHWAAIMNRMPSLRSRKAICIHAIDRAQSKGEVNSLIAAFILKRCGSSDRQSMAQSNSTSSEHFTNAVGALRLAGMYETANEVESFLSPRDFTDSSLTPESVTAAKSLVERVDNAVYANKKNRVNVTATRLKTFPAKTSSIKAPHHRTAGLLIAAVLTGLSASAATASETSAVRLAAPQQATLLDEATQAYERGIKNADSAEAKELLTTARTKYQVLVDSGIRNAELYTNLGNADLQTGELGRAIANYEHALLFDPGNPQTLRNLAFANSKVEGVVVQPTSQWDLREINNRVVDVIGEHAILWTLAISSLVFWGLLIVHAYDRRLPVRRLSALPLVLLIIATGSAWLTQSNAQFPWNAVVVANSVNLHAGDGAEFDAVLTIDTAQGHRVQVLGHRGKWTQIRTIGGQTGWIQNKDVEMVSAV